MGFVPIGAGDPEYGEVAALLLALTAELGYHVREVQTVTGGFQVPDAVAAQLEPYAVPDAPVVPVAEPKTPPPGWDDPLPEVDVFQDPDDGKFYTQLTVADAIEEAEGETSDYPRDESETDRESIRAWARENGHEVAERGRLKQSLIEAYLMAQAE